MGFASWLLNLVDTIISRNQVNVEMTDTALYSAGSHYDETLAARSTTVPSQMRWRDIHPAGLIVLPEGSAPAGAGYINFEDTLGGKFKLAIQRLEGMLYAVYGSRPAAYPMGGGGFNKCHWWDRVNPRCLWGPESWKPQCFAGGFGCVDGTTGFCNGSCVEYIKYGEYAAFGDSGGLGYSAPAVPIRPRSEDPAAQFSKQPADTIFPDGSISRDRADYPFSPEGRGWFGATNPGRNDVQPWLTEANGYIKKDGQNVTITYVKPSGVTTPTYVQLKYALKPPGGGWGGYTTVDMDRSGSTYTATIPEQDHGTQCRWYLKYFFDDTTPLNNDVTRYSPGGASVPDTSAQYTFTWFTHYNPYGSGLPEVLDNYNGVDIRHGTDFYSFDESETIQPNLITFVRNVISNLVGTTCTWDDSPCDDLIGLGHPGRFFHNPRLRSTTDGACCAYWPIKFYWSGSNYYPHYISGGKGDSAFSLNTYPLHNGQAELSLGSAAARKTWGGVEYAFDGDPLNNKKYGGTASWGVVPFAQKLQYTGSEDAQVYAKYEHVGLKSQMVIDAVHIQEIIDAMNYLVRYGLWTDDTIKSCKVKATGLMGSSCGSWQRTIGGTEPVRNNNFDCRWDCVNQRSTTQSAPCANCCAPTSNCPYPICQWVAYNDSQVRINPDTCQPETVITSYDYTEGIHCDDWETPSWEQCWNSESPCDAGKCSTVYNKTKTCTADGVLPTNRAPCASYEENVQVACGTPPGSCGLFGVPDTDCGIYVCQQSCYWRDVFTNTMIPCTSRNSLGSPSLGCGASASYTVAGFEYRYCTGPRCTGGWDANHGTKIKKHRFDHVWHNPDFYEVATGPLTGEAAGNCYGDIVVCGNLEIGTYPTSWFQEVRRVSFSGQASPWASGCDCSASPLSCPTVPATQLPPGLPGIGLHDTEGGSLCSQIKVANPSGVEQTTCSCTLSDFGPCNGNSGWLAIDLNLDNTGKPYAEYRGRTLTDAVYNGKGIPVLVDYDMTKDPTIYMHDCPCETLTGAARC